MPILVPVTIVMPILVPVTVVMPILVPATIVMPIPPGSCNHSYAYSPRVLRVKVTHAEAHHLRFVVCAGEEALSGHGSG